MEEQRRDIRVKALLGAVVNAVESNEKIQCQVRSISETGALLTLSNAHSLPSEFILTISNRGLIYRTRAVWRNMTEVGVEFLDALHNPKRTIQLASSMEPKANPGDLVKEELPEIESGYIQEIAQTESVLDAEETRFVEDEYSEDDALLPNASQLKPEEPIAPPISNSLGEGGLQPLIAVPPQAQTAVQDGKVWAELKRLELEHLKLKREMMEIKARLLALVS